MVEPERELVVLDDRAIAGQLAQVLPGYKQHVFSSALETLKFFQTATNAGSSNISLLICPAEATAPLAAVDTLPESNKGSLSPIAKLSRKLSRSDSLKDHDKRLYQYIRDIEAFRQLPVIVVVENEPATRYDAKKRVFQLSRASFFGDQQSLWAKVKPVILDAWYSQPGSIKESTKDIVRELKHLREHSGTLEMETSRLRSHNQEKDKTIQHLEAKLKVLRRAESVNTLETPLQVATTKLQQLLDEGNLTAEVRSEISAVLNSLASTNLYMPHSARSSEISLDPVTKSWLMAEHAFKPEAVKTNSRPLRRYTPAKDGEVECVVSGSLHRLAPSRRPSAMLSPAFSPFEFREVDLVPLAVDIFQYYNLLERFKIPVETMKRFVFAVRSRYRRNPYHNFAHGFDVLQTLHTLFGLCNCNVLLSSTEIFALLIAALCHDVDHPGTNNAYQINTRSKLSLLHNDKSVLENHHAVTTFLIINSPDCNILEHLTEQEYKEVRRVTIDNILSTDMAYHFEVLGKFDSKVKTNFDHQQKEDREIFEQVLTKCSDISNVCKPYDTAYKWSIKLGREFLNQGDAEKKLGLPVAPFMDRDQANPAKNTCNFIDFMARPLFTSLATLLSPTKIFLSNLEDNYLRFKQLYDDSEADPAAKLRLNSELNVDDDYYSDSEEEEEPAAIHSSTDMNDLYRNAVQPLPNAESALSHKRVVTDVVVSSDSV